MQTQAAPRTVQIVSRWDATRVLFTFEAPEGLESGLWLRAALEAAAESDANLSDANLSGANLSDADLSDADLSDANLSGADLSGADLSGADLSGANLSGANLSDADLSDADLSGANLSDADLSDADLSDANLSGADLSDANLSGANLSDADLSDADLSDANLSGADLSDANLSDANLSDANLSGANLSDANLSVIKADFYDVLLRAPREVSALRAALLAGKVDGSTYEGSCACLVGTIANSRGANYQELGSGLSPDSGRPIERFFMNIRRGDTPEANQPAQIVVEWIDEFVALMRAAVPSFVEAQP